MKDVAWEKTEWKALSMPYLLLAYEVFYNVAGEATSVKLWTKLEDLYMTKFLTIRMYLKQQLFTLWMQKATNLYEHLNESNRVVAQLTGIRVNHEDKVLILLSSLPAAYGYLVTTLVYGKETISMEAVTVVVLSNELQKMTQQSDMQSRDIALVVKAKKKTKLFITADRQKKPLFEVKCLYYHRKGHI